MSLGDTTVTALRWLRRLLLVAVLSYFSYSMLLMGYILVGTSCQPYGQENFYFYRMGGVLLLLGGAAILFFTVRWLSRLIRTGQKANPI
jgi:hypothetical protein